MNRLTDIPDIEKASIQTMDDLLFRKNNIGIHVLRLDKIHTIVSGNKWFKLKYYLKDAIAQKKKGIVTFGGAYSNHLIATAYACRQAGLSSIGIVRGERPSTYAATLSDLQSYGMDLRFYPRQEYKDKELKVRLRQLHPDFLMVEEGGQGSPGIRGAEEILQLRPFHAYTHVICSVGTGTMITGIINSALPEQEIIGIPAIKTGTSGNAELSDFIRRNTTSENYSLQFDFHFGGYAKKTNDLIDFMNHLYHQHNIPTDFVYTGKLFYGVMKMVETGFFKPGANILLIHSGGLQGNRSLPKGMLHF